MIRVNTFKLWKYFSHRPGCNANGAQPTDVGYSQDSVRHMRPGWVFQYKGSIVHFDIRNKFHYGQLILYRSEYVTVYGPAGLLWIFVFQDIRRVLNHQEHSSFYETLSFATRTFQPWGDYTAVRTCLSLRG